MAIAKMNVSKYSIYKTLGFSGGLLLTRLMECVVIFYFFAGLLYSNALFIMYDNLLLTTKVLCSIYLHSMSIIISVVCSSN
jgi:hypothetical protein